MVKMKLDFKLTHIQFKVGSIPTFTTFGRDCVKIYKQKSYLQVMNFSKGRTWFLSLNLLGGNNEKYSIAIDCVKNLSININLEIKL